MSITTFSQLERAMEYVNAYDDSIRPTNDGGLITTGSIVMYAGSSVPNGWLLCNGSTASRTTYADLYSAIGTTYGSGNGSTTFTLPDFRNKFPEGAGSNYSIGTSVSAGLPQITGYFDVNVAAGSSTNYVTVANASGAISIGDGSGTSLTSETSGSKNTFPSTRLTIAATSSNSTYDASTTVQPKARAIYYIIKT